MILSRRTLLRSALYGTSLLAMPALAQESGGMPAWHLGYRNAPAEGFAPSVMQRVAGRMPEGLAGTLYRNGPAWFSYGDDYASHWFDGDGMVQAIRFEGGHAVHRGAFVQTPKHKAEQAAGRFLAPGFGTVGDPDFPVTSADDTSAANTSVLVLGKELLALWEAGSAWSLDPDTLASNGPKAFRDDLAGMPFLAHPKREPDGRVWNLAVGGRKVGIYRLGADGDLQDFRMVDMEVAAYLHDWAMTRDEIVLLVQPWIMQRFIPPFVDGLDWQPERGLVAMVFDKADLSLKRRVECPARAFFHTGSAWTDSDGTIHLDVSTYDEPVLGSGGAAALLAGRYDAQADELSPEFCLLSLPVRGPGVFRASGVLGEFPQTDPRRSGLRRSHAVCVTGSVPNRPGPCALTRVNWDSGRHETFDFGTDHIVEEHLVIPKPGMAAEADAWVIGTTLNLKARASEVHVFDLARLADGPVASWRAPRAWPLGFHGTFAPA
jgi:carotenoid cleavage dioxygenase-like enzyme